MDFVDDGTLDTVIECHRCGEWLRYSFDMPFNTSDEEAGDQYTAFREWAVKDAADQHECAMEGAA